MKHQFENVNSSHHQAIDRVADGFEVEAWCTDDDIIEQVRLRDYPFALAVQYHPERGKIYDALFDDFFLGRIVEGVEEWVKRLLGEDFKGMPEMFEGFRDQYAGGCQSHAFLASYHGTRSVLLGFRAQQSRRGRDIENAISSRTILPFSRLLDSPSLRYRLDKRGPTFSEAVSLHH